MVKKVKYFIAFIIFLGALLLIPNMSKAAVSVTRNIYSNNGSMKFNFTGLTLDTTHEYQYGLTKTAASTVENWYLITEYTSSTATVDILTTTTELREVINTVDTGYVTIKDKTTGTVILEPYAVDLKIPYLQVTNYTVINNGKEFNSGETNCINIALRNAQNSKAYYQYEKITDQNIINKYKEIKAKNGDFTELQSLLKQTPPNANWSSWGYWNGHNSTGMEGFGYTERPINVPDTGLYYMWVYFSGNNIKNIYGYILVDNLEADIALDSITLPKTKTVELGKTLTLTPTFSPSNTTNKIVTWSSSNESVATVSNAGVVTPKKIGSTIITVTSQDGSKKATCTVTVTTTTSSGSTTGTTSGGTTKTTSTNGSTTKTTSTGSTTGTTKASTTGSSSTSSSTSGSTTKDSTTASGKLPQAGLAWGISIAIVAIAGVGIFTFKKYRNLRDI